MKEESFKFLVGPWSSFFNSAGSGIIVSDPDPAELKSWLRDQPKLLKILLSLVLTRVVT